MNFEKLDPHELGELRLCHNCVGEPFLKAIIVDQPKGVCAFCDDKASSMALIEFSDHIDLAFNKHYVRTAVEPEGYEYAMMRDPEGSYHWEREGEESHDAIANAAGLDERAAESVRRILEEKHGYKESWEMGDETEFLKDAHYEESSVETHEMHSLWTALKKSLRQQARFLNPLAVRTLDKIFNNVSALKTNAPGEIVVKAGPGRECSSLYRARPFKTMDQAVEAMEDPPSKLGPPPHEYASAGRMNAKGVSVFYGAFGEQTAIAEVRPPVGSVVVTAKFELLNDLKLLDLRKLGELQVTGSIFDPQYAANLEQAEFLRHLSWSMSLPVQPGDEDNEYLVTQVIAEYLWSKQGLHGLIYSSPQASSDEANVALFHEVSKVKPLELPKGSRLHSSSGYGTEEGFEVDFSIYEESAQQNVPAGDDDFFGFSNPFDPAFDDHRQDSLELDLQSLRVHEVKQVQVRTESHRVRCQIGNS